MAITEQETIELMGDIKNWKQLVEGYYRFMICSCGWYEIQVLHHALGKPLEEAEASLFLVGDWYTSDEYYFGRESIITECTVSDCIKEAQKNYKEHRLSGWKE